MSEYLSGYDDGRFDECRTWIRLSLPRLLQTWWLGRRDKDYK